MERIAQALNVAQSTVAEDLRDLSTIDKSKLRPKTASNPKGSGCPKGSKKRETPVLDRARHDALCYLQMRAAITI
jgi:hypothetical protein